MQNIIDERMPVMDRILGPETQKSYQRRIREGFIAKYLSGDAVLDIGFRGRNPHAVPITDKAVGIELDYPGYDGIRLPFPDESQDAVFVSHCLEHIEDYRAVLADWYRVLKISGYLIIAVPHQHLYERKALPPSRFNAGHKRFYTPRSLLAEVEEALPAGGYRIRSLRDIDDGFDYTLPPEVHARGCYEIELVLQKIAMPAYADRLRPNFVAEELIRCFASILAQGIRAARAGRTTEVKQCREILGRLPLPPFKQLARALSRQPVHGAEDAAPTREELVDFLRPVIAASISEFDEEFYLTRHPAIATAVAEGRIPSARAHYIAHGYFESRATAADNPVFE
jgi:SAM-dependent methyltransferase